MESSSLSDTVKFVTVAKLSNKLAQLPLSLTVSDRVLLSMSFGPVLFLRVLLPTRTSFDPNHQRRVDLLQGKKGDEQPDCRSDCQFFRVGTSTQHGVLKRVTNTS